ncbi:MAG TPA: hypothetical protein VD968_17435 [Pyrinomonadaceae bacterium]|nr:hypothetical protein [Pyrinomonadaceae bacterium]
MLKREVLGVFHNPWRDDYDPRRSIGELYRRAVWLKANPRSETYMRALFKERYPEGRFVSTAEDWKARLASADTVVLLYPDSTGLGFSRVEREAFAGKKEWATVRALNGRRRDFVLSRRVLRQLRRRRFLEVTMLGEAAVVVPFVVVTPFFVLSDFVRGRR